MHPTQKPAAPVEVTPAFTLRAAATYIERHGWITGDYYSYLPDTGPLAQFLNDWPAACALGGIAVAVHGYISIDPYDQLLPGWPLAEKTRRTLYDHLVSVGETGPGANKFEIAECVGNWNDHPTQTLEQITAALRAAADDWDRIHGGAA